MNSDAGEELVKKVFKKKFKEIEDRESYAGDFGDEFWRSWPRKEMPTKAEHWISKEKLLELAKMLNYNSWKLKALVKWLDEGAELGIEHKESRMPTKGPNSRSAEAYGDRVTDSIREWIDMEIAAGPFTEGEVREMVKGGMEEIKITPMSVTIKDNGKARICKESSHVGTLSLNNLW